MKIKIGTRKSKLALRQTEMVIEAIKKDFPEVQTEVVHISTKGDRIVDRPLVQFGGKGIFVTEIEKALQNGEIDIAIHSAKDLPVELGENLEISAVLKRGDYRDVLVTLNDKPFENKADFVIGTGSIRRQQNFKKIYSDVSFKDIRGNVDTRLKKLLNGEYDGIILAAAGLERLDLIDTSKFNYQYFDYNEFLPAPCQGIIAIECRKNDFVQAILKKISNTETFILFETERFVATASGSDCSIPIGAFSRIDDGIIYLTVARSPEKIISGETDISENISLAEELISCL